MAITAQEQQHSVKKFTIFSDALNLRNVKIKNVKNVKNF